MPCYWYYFCIFYIFHFFQIIMVSLFLAWHDQYFIIFKDSNVFEFTNFSFKTKYNNTVVYSVNRNIYSRRENKRKNCWNNSLIKSAVYLLILGQNSMIFKRSPNSLKDSYFTGEFKTGGVLIHRWIKTRGVFNLGSLNIPLHQLCAVDKRKKSGISSLFVWGFIGLISARILPMLRQEMIFWSQVRNTLCFFRKGI